ncbi:hypothetical protein F2Q68_00008975 [Brassica cretica]|uniref:Uncharacterized protein n=1 Tax=Brassica cretica TaxID=69181 RepID=A0A8S9L021_BRACR|nr:hypothetical protein F2Q68_00008975 [Brassica cretica]
MKVVSMGRSRVVRLGLGLVAPGHFLASCVDENASELTWSLRDVALKAILEPWRQKREQLSRVALITSLLVTENASDLTWSLRDVAPRATLELQTPRMRATWTSRSDHVAPSWSDLVVAPGRFLASCVDENASDLTWSLRDVALIDRKRERPHVVAARRHSESDSQAPDTENASDLDQSL